MGERGREGKRSEGGGRDDGSSSNQPTRSLFSSRLFLFFVVNVQPYVLIVSGRGKWGGEGRMDVEREG